ncbi:MAG: ABC transporter permease [Clostridia bacterium]|nr:ABC transporter permease [Clostridia bacterium]MBQ8430260.1 ABC transporter permease [Clostridia bacterium]
MAKYILKRLLYMLAVLLILSFLVFAVYNMLPVDKAADMAMQEIAANKHLNYAERYLYWQRRYGLDGGIVLRYFRWLGFAPFYDGRYSGLIQGDFGSSVVYGKPVVEVIKAPLLNTVFLNLFVAVAALAITIPLGIFCAVKKGSKRDLAVQVGTIIGYSMPVFITAILFIWLFAVKLDIFPVSGMSSVGKDYTGFRAFLDKLYHFALPLIVMTFCSLGGMTRYVRAAMVEALRLDCVRTARAKGLRERLVVKSHAWRNALIPVVALVIGWLLGVFSGSIMIENIFGINGIGKVYFDALTAGDNEIVLAMQMFYVLLALVGNLLVDLAYGFVDPRVRLA